MFYLTNTGDILRLKNELFVSVIDNATFTSHSSTSGILRPIYNGLAIPGVLVDQLKPATGILTIEHIHHLSWLTNGIWDLANELIYLDDAVSIRKEFFDASHKAKPNDFCAVKSLRLFGINTLL